MNVFKHGKITLIHGDCMEYLAGLEFVGIELDADYYAAAVDRFKRETAQEALF